MKLQYIKAKKIKELFHERGKRITPAALYALDRRFGNTVVDIINKCHHARITEMEVNLLWNR